MNYKLKCINFVCSNLWNVRAWLNFTRCFFICFCITTFHFSNWNAFSDTVIYYNIFTIILCILLIIYLNFVLLELSNCVQFIVLIPRKWNLMFINLCFIVIKNLYKCFYNQLQLAQLPSELSAEELQSVTGGESSGAASPLTARSLRLERVAHALALSQEELRRYLFRYICKWSLLFESVLIIIIKFYFTFPLLTVYLFLI